MRQLLADQEWEKSHISKIKVLLNTKEVGIWIRSFLNIENKRTALFKKDTFTMIVFHLHGWINVSRIRLFERALNVNLELMHLKLFAPWTWTCLFIWLVQTFHVSKSRGKVTSNHFSLAFLKHNWRWRFHMDLIKDRFSLITNQTSIKHRKLSLAFLSGFQRPQLGRRGLLSSPSTTL